LSGSSRVFGASRTVDMERDDLINLRVGANFHFDRLVVHPEIVILSETTILGGVSYTF